VAAKMLMHNITKALCETAQQVLASDAGNRSRVNHAYQPPCQNEQQHAAAI
jgi:hypothetical protein